MTNTGAFEFIIFTLFSVIYTFFTVYFSLIIINTRREKIRKIKRRAILIVSLICSVLMFFLLTYNINKRTLNESKYIDILKNEKCLIDNKSSFMLDNKISNYERLTIESRCK